MERFYYGMTGGGTDRRIGGGHVPYIMISAATLWNPKMYKFRNYRPPSYDGFFLDSAGFTVQARWGKYPFTLEQYVDLAARLNVDHAATLDYPCEPKVNREVHATNEDRIRETVMNADRALRTYRLIPWVPVIQGYTAGEYHDCIGMLEAVGAVRPFMAVGLTLHQGAKGPVVGGAKGRSEGTSRCEATRLWGFTGTLV